MILSISQLAFNSFEDLKTNLSILKKNDIQNLEIIYSKMESNFEEYLKFFSDEQISTKSTQSILFNSGVIDFLSPSFTEHIKQIIENNRKFGVHVLVLGSPKQRVEYNEEELVKQFKIIDSLLIKENQILCIEPNCKIYEGSYFFTVDEIAKFIKNGEFKNIKTMLDTHNIINEGQSPSEVYDQYKNIISHVHISENRLSDFEESFEHLKLSNTLKLNNFNGIITYEVLPSVNLKNSLKKFNRIYK